MKNKLMYLFVIITAFIVGGISVVKADSINYYDTFIPNVDQYYDSADISDYIHNSYSTIFNYYIDNYYDTYPYYMLSIDHAVTGENRVDMFLYLFKDVPSFNSMFFGSIYNVNSFGEDVRAIRYSIYCKSGYSYCYNDLSAMISPISNTYNLPLFDNSNGLFKYYSYAYYDSNFDLIYSGSDIINVNYQDHTFAFSISPGDIIPTHKDRYTYSSNFINVNLNDYSSIILNLKDYSLLGSSNAQFHIIGQLCLTPLYDYGTSELTKYKPDNTLMGCLPRYTHFTSYGLHISDDDRAHHVVYYARAYNKSIENILRVDSNLFDITYITSENEDNPIITVDNQTYNVIPFDSLSDSAESTYNSYNTPLCSIGDLDCANSMGLSIEDIFTNPLKALKSVWSACTSMFLVISTFITLLPGTMQAFLYISFTIAIILGIIKIVM